MSKPKIILAAVGGAIVVVSVVLGILIWNVASGRSETVDELDSAIVAAEGLMKKPVYPGPASVKALESNRVDYASWSASARELASQGDHAFGKTTPSAFKAFLVEEARRLSELPGGVEGKLVKPGFAFGFSAYITGDEMPKDSDLPNLQREWYDISTVIETLAVTGVVEIADVARQMKTPAPEEQEANTPRKGKKRKNVKAQEEESATAPLVSTFTIVFRAKPQGLVNAINGIVSSKRFIVVDEMSFAREQDALANVLGGDAKKEEGSSRRSSRRSRRGAESESFGDNAAEKDGSTSADGVITDPAKAPLLKVSMTFSVYDFRTRQNEEQNENGKGEEK